MVVVFWRIIMAMRRKTTGIIYEDINIKPFFDEHNSFWKVECDGEHIIYNSLDRIKEDWEVYEEPKNPCFINWFGEISELLGHISDREIEKLKQIGNYFETREEGEKAVEKIKAWKRLETKGFRFDGWYGGSRTMHFRIDSLDKEGDCLPHFIDDDTANDLDLLFSEKGVPVDRKKYGRLSEGDEK